MEERKTEFRIVGIGGQGRSGKDTLAKIFMDDGYFGVSFGDIVREYTRVRHSKDKYPISRANMTETSDWLRLTYGPDFVLNEALKKFEQSLEAGNKYTGLVLFSIRAPIEADYINSRGGVLIYVECDDHVRYERAMKDLRVGEPKLSFKDFMAQENLQMEFQPGVPKEVQMNMPYIKSHSTVLFENNRDDLDDFISHCHQLVGQIDNYVGIKDRQIIFNGA